MIPESFGSEFYQGYTASRNALDPAFYIRRTEVLATGFQKILSNFLARNLPGERQNGNLNILDIGCGEKILGKAVKTLLPAANVFSLDLDFRVLDQYPDGKSVNADARFLPFANASFDMLGLTELIEHLDEQSGRVFLKEAARVLRTGGLFYLETPNNQSLEAVVMGEQWPMHLPEHLTFFSPQKIKDFLEQSGFAKVTTGTRYENDEQVNEPWKVISNLGIPFKQLLPWCLKLFLTGSAIRLLNKGSKTTAVATK